MTNSEQAPSPVVTLSDWAFAGNRRHRILVRASGTDSLAARILENRTTEADNRQLAQVKNPHCPNLATIEDVERLLEVLQSRYRVWLDSPETKLAMAKRAVREIAQHTSTNVRQVWNMTLGETADALATIPLSIEATSADDDYAPVTQADDPDQYLSGQKRSIFRFLRDHHHWVSFDTLAHEAELWRVVDPVDKTIDTALTRLSEALKAAESRWFVDWSKRDRRAKVELPPSNAQTYPQT